MWIFLSLINAVVFAAVFNIGFWIGWRHEEKKLKKSLKERGRK